MPGAFEPRRGRLGRGRVSEEGGGREGGREGGRAGVKGSGA